MSTLLQWIPALIVILLGIAFCFRKFKRGLSTLEKFRGQHLASILAQEEQIREDKKNISRSEHLHLVHVALSDLLHLEGDKPGFRLDMQDSSFLLDTPEGVWRITLVMREQALIHSHKMLHGKPNWILEGMGRTEEYSDLAELMRNLTAYLRGEGESVGVTPMFSLRRIRSGGGFYCRKKG